MSKFVANGVHGAGGLLSDVGAVFFAAVQSAEATRQAAIKAAGTPAAVKAADVAFHKAVRDAAVAAGNAPHLGGPSRAALQELGSP